MTTGIIISINNKSCSRLFFLFFLSRMGNTCMPCGARGRGAELDDEYLAHDFGEEHKHPGFIRRTSSGFTRDSGAGVSIQSSSGPKRPRTAAHSTGNLRRVKSAGSIDGATRRAKSASSLRKALNRSTVSIKSSHTAGESEENLGRCQDLVWSDTGCETGCAI